MNRATTTLLLALACAGCAGGRTATDLPIVPRPASLSPGRGTFEADRTLTFVTDDDAELRRLADAFAAPLRSTTGWPVTVRSGPCTRGSVCLRLGGSDPPEGYTLVVTGDSLVVRGAEPAGVFYGLQTLTQMLPSRPDAGGFSVTAATIVDRPRFPYRSRRRASAYRVAARSCASTAGGTRARRCRRAARSCRSGARCD